MRVLQRQLREVVGLVEREQARATAAWARVERLVQQQQAPATVTAAAVMVIDEPREWAGEKAMSRTSVVSWAGMEEHREQALELRDRWEQAEAALAVYRRIVESSQDSLLLLRASGSGSAAADNDGGDGSSNVGPVVVFANRTTNGVLKTEGVLQSPLLAFVQPCEWRAGIDAFTRALTAGPNTLGQSKSLSSASASALALAPLPDLRRLPLRLHDGMVVVSAFLPTDEAGTVLCTLARRGAAPPHKG